MDAIFLLRLCDWLYLVAIAAWLGPMLWVLAGGGEAVPGGRRASLYVWGVTAGSLAVSAFVCGVLAVPEYRGWGALEQIAVLMGGIVAMIWAEHAGAGAERRRRLVLLIVAAGLVGCLAARAWRPDPRTRGIVEPGVEERARERYERASVHREPMKNTPSPPATSGDRPGTR